MMPSIAIPVGKKRRNGATMAASLELLKKFCTTSDIPSVSIARSHKAINNLRNWPKSMYSVLTKYVIIERIKTVTVTQIPRCTRKESAYIHLLSPIILRDSFMRVSLSLTISLKM